VTRFMTARTTRASLIQLGYWLARVGLDFAGGAGGIPWGCDCMSPPLRRVDPSSRCSPTLRWPGHAAGAYTIKDPVRPAYLIFYLLGLADADQYRLWRVGRQTRMAQRRQHLQVVNLIRKHSR
jgi:hypothetical protein